MSFEGNHRVVYYVRWELDPIQRLALGFGEFTVPANVLDVGAETYSGLGELRNIPPLTSLVNGTADKASFSLAANEEMLALASGESDAVRDKRMTIGVLEYDGEWQPMSAGIKWVWSGWSDFLSIEYRAAGTTVTRGVAVSVSTLFSRRRKATFQYWTLADTKRRSPTDEFWGRTKILARGVNKVWPRFQN
jgi:hypothetical protein